jgi:hypothetical protein
MSLTFREAKSQLEASSVGELRNILEQAGRTTAEPISTEDFELLKAIYPAIKQGMSVEEALQLYNEAPASNLPIQEMFAAVRQEFLAASVEEALRQDVKQFYILYFQLWGEAIKSPEILKSEEVKAAAKTATSSTLEAIQEMNGSFLHSFRQRMRNKGFLPSVEPVALLESSQASVSVSGSTEASPNVRTEMG